MDPAQLIGIALLALFVFILLVALLPISIPTLDSHPHPLTDFPAAKERLAQIVAGEDKPALNPECHTFARDHGQKTERVILFFHGMTNCPRQFRELAQQFYDRGYNVIIWRTPFNGRADRNTSALQNLTAEVLRDTTEQAIDLASGYGNKVYVMGISGGGSMTAWAAQYRSDVKRAVVIAPVFGQGYVPSIFNTPIMNLFMRIPPLNFGGKGLDHAYPGNNTRGMGELFRFGRAIKAEAQQTKPAAHSMTLVLNDHDPAISNPAAEDVAKIWADHGAQVTVYHFPKSLNLRHDIIDVAQPDQPFDIIYPILIDLTEGKTPPH